MVTDAWALTLVSGLCGFEACVIGALSFETWRRRRDPLEAAIRSLYDAGVSPDEVALALAGLLRKAKGRG